MSPILIRAYVNILRRHGLPLSGGRTNKEVTEIAIRDYESRVAELNQLKSKMAALGEASTIAGQIKQGNLLQKIHNLTKECLRIYEDIKILSPSSA